MFASLLTSLRFLPYLLSSPFSLAIAAFQLWMLIHAIRQKEWMWAFFILVGFGFAALWYYFSVYRSAPSATRGFELPGAQDRRRIKELQAKIHHLDKAHHHFQLGDIFFQRGKLALAEASYRASLERDPNDIDTRAHLGQCLLRLKRPAEARPLLQGVVTENPRHDYGHSLMAFAETQMALGETDAAITTWQQVTAHNSYPRAKVQLAELWLAAGKRDGALAELKEVVSDDAHAPTFQRRRDRVWVRRAKALLRKN